MPLANITWSGCACRCRHVVGSGYPKKEKNYMLKKQTNKRTKIK